jgi:hypothetical protein
VAAKSGEELQSVRVTEGESNGPAHAQGDQADPYSALTMPPWAGASVYDSTTVRPHALSPASRLKLLRVLEASVPELDEGAVNTVRVPVGPEAVMASLGGGSRTTEVADCSAIRALPAGARRLLEAMAEETDLEHDEEGTGPDS